MGLVFQEKEHVIQKHYFDKHEQVEYLSQMAWKGLQCLHEVKVKRLTLSSEHDFFLISLF